MARRSHVLGFAVALAACGGGHTATPDAAIDAAIPYPAPHHALPQLTFLGGGVIVAPNLVPVTFAGDVNRDDYRAFVSTLVTSQWWTAVSAGYQLSTPTLAAPVELPDTVTAMGTLDNNTDLDPLLAMAITQQVLPAPDAHTLYVVFLPPNVTVHGPAGTTCQGVLAYHNYFTIGGQRIPFALIPKCHDGTFTVFTSHEVIEAATDPFFDGYYMFDDPLTGNTSAGEAADICDRFEAWTEGAYTYNRSWNNAAAARGTWPCQPADPGKPFFAAIPDTQTVPSITGTGTSDGYFVMNRGVTQSFAVDVISDGPLSGELGVFAGIQQSQDPTDVGPITGDVTATLAPASGHNGTQAMLTITIGAGAISGDHPFAMQAVLDAATYYAIPTILRVNP